MISYHMMNSFVVGTGIENWQNSEIPVSRYQRKHHFWLHSPEVFLIASSRLDVCSNNLDASYKTDVFEFEYNPFAWLKVFDAKNELNFIFINLDKVLN